MTDIVTYYSANAKPHERWLAYAVLPNGSQWLVRCTGETEEVAKTKAVALYEREKERVGKRYLEQDEPDLKSVHDASDNPWETAKQHHLAGKVWVINEITREKKRIDQSELMFYEGNGWVRGGPRSK